jgi:hypothetical protein
MIEKNKLAELIDAYAIAKASGNSPLLQMALDSLKEALDSVYEQPPQQPVSSEQAPLPHLSEDFYEQ